MSTFRKIDSVLRSQPTIEGAGVRLKRGFGQGEVPRFDPFLLLDDFHSSKPEDYTPGFPWHPHRGIETVTYMIHGEVKHGDSLGNQGTIRDGDIQWMTAGSGIIHQEMPQRQKDYLWGFQLWVNLPARWKMMEPRYQDIPSDTVPSVLDKNGVRVKVIAGKYGGIQGPVKDIVCDPEYLDVAVPAREEFIHTVDPEHTVIIYTIEGSGLFQKGSSREIRNEHVIVYGDGDRVSIRAQKEAARFLLVSGKPMKEPVAWNGPIVMNTEEELRLAFEEYRNGNFLKD